MLCRHLFKTTPLFHQNIGVGKAKQRRCFKVGTSGLLESAWHSLVVRLARTPLPLGLDMLMEPEESAFVNPAVMMATEDVLRKKAETKHYSYTGVPANSQRYRFVALNEMGRMLVTR